MKIKALFIAFVPCVALMFSCTQQFEPTYLDNIKVSSSYVAISTEGGSATVTLTAKGDWNISGVGTGKDEVDWITVNPMSGNAGENIELVFSAEADESGRQASVYINCGEQQQVINVIQGVPVASTVTCEEVINGVEGKLYRVTGICTAIANTSYGNWYLNDGTGEIYVYGTVNSSGSYDWASFNIEVGDEVTVEGRRTDYNGTIEFVDATFISVNKTLIQIDSYEPEDAVMPIEGGEVSVKLECKGNGFSVEIPDDAKSWLSIASVSGSSANPVVTFKAAANTDVDRSTVITFTTQDESETPNTYSINATLYQEGVIVDASAADVLSKADGLTRYRLTGTLCRDSEGNIYFRDYTGSLLVYSAVPVVENGEELGAWESLGAADGDVVALVARKSSYKDDPQLINAFVEKTIIDVVPVSVADFNAAAEDDTWYFLKGEVSSIDNTKYGNFDLKDETGTVYTYGLETGYGYDGSRSQGEFESLGVSVGDTLSIVGHRSSYNGTIQVADAFFVALSKKPVELPELPEAGTADDPYTVSSANTIFDSGAWTAYSNDKAYFKGIISKIEEVSTDYGNGTYYISEDGQEASEQLYIYRGYYLGNEKFASEDEIKVGDSVVICGNMSEYNGTFEITNSYIHSLNGVTE